MTTERFSKNEFEAMLPNNDAISWEAVGIEDREETYMIPVKPGVAIKVRSSVQANGVAAETGADSIRGWIVDPDTGSPLGSKVISYTTRLPGWQERTLKVLRELYKRGSVLQACPTCNKMMGIYKVKKDGPNKGRLFTKCWDHNHFTWLDSKGKGNVETPKHIQEKARANREFTDEEVWEMIYDLSSIKKRSDVLKDLIQEDANIMFYVLEKIYSMQTAYEQQAEVTKEDNKVGFSAFDAEILSSFAKQAKVQGLTEKQMVLAKKKVKSYAGQIERLLRYDAKYYNMVAEREAELVCSI